MSSENPLDLNTLADNAQSNPQSYPQLLKKVDAFNQSDFKKTVLNGFFAVIFKSAVRSSPLEQDKRSVFWK